MSAQSARRNRKAPSTRTGARLWPLPSAGVPGHDHPIRLRPPKLAILTEDHTEELIDLLAEMLSGDPEAKAFPVRRAA
jgi:hypothetical protein